MSITLNEKDLKILLIYDDELREIIDKRQEFLASKFNFSKPAEAQNIDLSGINWMVKGGSPTPDNAPFSYAFPFTQDGKLREEAEALVRAIQSDGEVKQSGFTYHLGGRDNKLLNRVQGKK